ncbi:MAG: hypothetical protein H7X79_12090 [Sporomusaceae bacterium]|nr:hypothetical protein [Sporomusaceae bacterium]
MQKKNNIIIPFANFVSFVLNHYSPLLRATLHKEITKIPIAPPIHAAMMSQYHSTIQAPPDCNPICIDIDASL